MGRRVIVVATTIAFAIGLTACGSQGISSSLENESEEIQRGAQLFADRCSGCHTLDVVGAQGGSTKVSDRERVDGPNFNVRPVDEETVLYAIRNGGYSGSIMPENIVVGEDADAVAAFLAKFAGRERDSSSAAQDEQP